MLGRPSPLYCSYSAMMRDGVAVATTTSRTTGQGTWCSNIVAKTPDAIYQSTEFQLMYRKQLYIELILSERLSE